VACGAPCLVHRRSQREARFVHKYQHSSLVGCTGSKGWPVLSQPTCDPRARRRSPRWTTPAGEAPRPEGGGLLSSSSGSSRGLAVGRRGLQARGGGGAGGSGRRGLARRLVHPGPGPG
jgi:hypothetical protein